MVTVGDHELSHDAALSHVQTYARRYAETVLYFDLGGSPMGMIEPSDRVTVTDLGRMTLINADLSATDAANLLHTPLAWASVAPRAQLEHADPDEPDGLYAAMHAMWEAVTAHPGIGAAKASKLLHIKRPFAFPILDRNVRKTYKGRFAKEQNYWRSIREDLINGSDDLEQLRTALGSADDEYQRRASRLPLLRILDIIAWSIQR